MHGMVDDAEAAVVQARVDTPPCRPPTNSFLRDEVFRIATLSLPTAAPLLLATLPPLRDEPEVASMAVVATCICSELLLHVAGKCVRIDGGGAWGLATRIVTTAGIIAWHVALQVAHHNLDMFDGLLYASLVLLTLLGWLSQREIRYSRRLAFDAMEEAQETRAHYDGLKKLVRRRLDYYTDSESEDDADHREHQIVPPTPVELSLASLGRPDLALPEALRGRKFDRDLALKIASHIRKRSYSLGQFYDDVQKAFPELQLYLVNKPPPPKRADDDESERKMSIMSALPSITSGLHPDDEYRRTIGALFAVYWLMRIGIDGERGFSFGVDDHWVPKLPEPPAPPQQDPNKRRPSTVPKIEMLQQGFEKRMAFYQQQDWGRLQQLLIDAGMLERRQNKDRLDDGLAEHLRKSGSPDRYTSGGNESRDNSVHGALNGGNGHHLVVNVERTMAMLALTAFHDVMKIEALLPRVRMEHAPYLGYKAGDTINDHDCALSYILDHYSDQLPSFVQLNELDQKTVRFTQSKMQFNHGWLVQGEAPPSSLFCKFKQVLLKDGVTPSDVAFYFVHWLTDLAGAEPSPLGGGEKFVLKFPHAVLDSFIRSFSVLNELAIHPETKVMEEYLVRTWGELKLGPVPSDVDGIALMRLALQAQTPDKQQAVLEAFGKLSDTDRETLRTEMARTGIYGQTFQRGPDFGQHMGPAFLVYYSPAFVRTLSPSQAEEALKLLAEIYRRARKLWPLRPTNSNDHAVTIRIDQIKELKLHQIREEVTDGNAWVLCRKNDLEGVIEKHPVERVPELMKQEPSTVLKFFRKAGGSPERSRPSQGTGGVRSPANSAASSNRSQALSVPKSASSDDGSSSYKLASGGGYGGACHRSHVRFARGRAMTESTSKDSSAGLAATASAVGQLIEQLSKPYTKSDGSHRQDSTASRKSSRVRDRDRDGGLMV